MPNRFFITGTDTNVGKTVVSALLCAALGAIYWKPIQTGTREGSDRATVMRIAQMPKNRTLPEAYRFAPPVSPHLAARLAEARIELRKIKLPQIADSENLIVEGAGGALVPINSRQLMTDLMAHLNLPVLLVARTSLGTINHTLLSIAALRAARLDLRGVVMVGKENRENRAAIEHYGEIEIVGAVPPLAKVNRATLVRIFRKNFNRQVFPA
ncbi:MAG: dethiobiotin synthase [Candidatus Acidiferrales bacterium]|jgi:dethiobiotin synthase|nr:dethiobiotin synthase [Candidatus Acidoferrales bacterium]